MPTEHIIPGDILTSSDGKNSGLVVSVHENEYGIFYNLIVDGDLIVVADGWKKLEAPREFNSDP